MASKCKRRPFPIALCGIAKIGGCGGLVTINSCDWLRELFRSWQRRPKFRRNDRAIPAAGESGQYGIDWLPCPLPELTERSGFTAY